MYPIITISREIGSGGRAVGMKVAEKLGIPFLDREFVESVAEQTGIDKDVIEQKGEYASKWDKAMNYKFYQSLYHYDPQDFIFYAQKKVIVDKAKEGPCVIVGRCADAILAEEGIPALNVFIHADTEYRKENIIKRFGQQDESIDKYLEKKDKGRKYYYKYYTNREWGDFKNYHINLDTSYLGEELCAEIIVKAIKDMEAAK